MGINNQKIRDLHHYYLSNGFNHTVDEIASGLHITHKTFFNRYVSKDNSILLACQYSHLRFEERLCGRFLMCNHSVEELMFFVYEMLQYREKERVFFEFECKMMMITSEDAPYVSILNNIFSKGIRHSHFSHEVNLETYITYFLHNICQFLPYATDKVDTLQFILEPILDERGYELLRELNLEQFLF